MTTVSIPLSLLLFLQAAPYRNIFEAFKNDCEAFGMQWYTPSAQQMCVALLLKHPLVIKFPTRLSNRHAFLKFFIMQLEQPWVMSILQEIGSEDPINAELMEEYIRLTTSTADSSFNSNMCYKTFFCHSPGIEKKLAYVTVRVASGHYDNVGYSLWPSAFALIQLLAQELASPSPKLIPAEGQLRILELGAGVGLTPLMLHRRSDYQRRVDGYMLSDYQLELVDNMLFNFENNGIIPVDKDAFGAHVTGKGHEVPHAVDLIDWNELERNEVLLKKWGCNLILAADCVYEAESIEAFVSTIRLALLATPGAIAIVVQTHRQETTLKRLFDAVQMAKIKVQSYRVDPASESHLDGSEVMILQSCVYTETPGTLSDGLVLRRGIMNDSGTLLLADSTHSRDSNMEKDATNIAERWDGAWIGTFFTGLEATLGIHVLTL